MKRVLALLIAIGIVFSISACGSEPDYENQNEKIVGNTITVGNYVMTIPDGFSATKSSDLYFLSSDESSCTISIFAVNLAVLDEKHVREYISTQAEAFFNEKATRYSENIQKIKFGDITVLMDMYAEVSSDGFATINTNGTFTDSWYGYTVAIECESGSDRISEDFYSFAEFCASAEYIGEKPRFDFVQ